MPTLVYWKPIKMSTREMLYNKIMRKLFLLSTTYLLLTTSAFAQSVDILWQGNGYVPPFYEGRTLWAKQSVITLVAVPEGLGNPSSLNYKWTRNGTVLGNISGTGRNSLSFKDSIFSKPYAVKVEIIDGDEEVLAEATETLRSKEVSLLIYENHPLYGYMFHREVGGVFKLNREEVTLSAFPLFAGQREGSYSWRTNDGTASGGTSATYRVPEGASGASNVRVSFSDSSVIMQPVERSFLIQFGE